ncbi:hypothetical protein ABEF92_001931 [Exophiala dermatitidis]|uniref:Uncharacterized protein n=1 Tax=Exophiala dermatitidis (strain ATCC 34100 / CBS 525.76 / NIH/UT8656) TaxID=858893 RepID=H6BUX0_EXODN|nr:uncharacterized protein HMPREF1120_03099 [Exophiala dermatitidis NIH/UT8656]EHY54940.1 hypothetical protein HMPREF1120_03099 [Exophiala dermatitidis NIH/UT8656]
MLDPTKSPPIEILINLPDFKPPSCSAATVYRLTLPGNISQLLETLSSISRNSMLDLAWAAIRPTGQGKGRDSNGVLDLAHCCGLLPDTHMLRLSALD